MKCDADIIKYLSNNYSICDALDLLRKNSLYYKFADKIVEQRTEEKEKQLMLNRVLNSFNMVVACDIFSNIKKNHIEYIAFKGFVLSQILYDRPNERACGDIDFFVKPQYFDKVYLYLIEEGFSLLYENGMSNQHHVVLKKGRIGLELHRNLFNPMIGIDEDFLRKSLQLCTINNCEIKTFNLTATLLHLIYHLYMDTYLATGSLYNIFANKSIPKAGRFLYRAYEIALFSQKYYNQIKWEEIIGDIKKQKLRIIFKKMIMDILDIFPATFPNSFINTVFNLDYMECEWDNLYNYILASDKSDITELLSDYIDDNWILRKEHNIHIQIGESILLTKNPMGGEKDQDLCCSIETEKVAEGFRITFKVSNNDFCISQINDYDTCGSDGVHLLLCGTEEYSYNSIFFFQKEIDGKIKVIVCDVLNNVNEVLSEDLVTTQFQKTDSDYTITAIFSDEFIEKHHLNSYFYMGLVISDCSSETRRRKNQLILSEEDSQWYNPIYFAKIVMK